MLQAGTSARVPAIIRKSTIFCHFYIHSNADYVIGHGRKQLEVDITTEFWRGEPGEAPRPT
jgi:hypothetical protein